MLLKTLNKGDNKFSLYFLFLELQIIIYPQDLVKGNYIYKSILKKMSQLNRLTCLERLKMAVGLAGLLWREAMPADGGFGPSSGSRSSAFSTGKPE